MALDQKCVKVCDVPVNEAMLLIPFLTYICLGEPRSVYTTAV
jgi:hypothetical protein